MGLHNSVRVWIMRFTGSLCLTGFAISPLSASELNLASNCDPESWLANQAEMAKECLDVHELVQLIINMRNYVVSQGCEIPLLMPFLDDCRRSLSNQGFFIDDATFDSLKREIQSLERGNRIDLIRHHHPKKKKDKKELKVNSKTAVGFLKFVAGSLLCIVPVPLIQGAGIGLAILGVSEMADGAREQSDERDRQEENQRLNRQMGIQN